MYPGGAPGGPRQHGFVAAAEVADSTVAAACSFVKARVKVRQYHHGSHAVFHGPRCLGRYDAQGALQMAALDTAA